MTDNSHNVRCQICGKRLFNGDTASHTHPHKSHSDEVLERRKNENMKRSRHDREELQKRQSEWLRNKLGRSRL